MAQWYSAVIILPPIFQGPFLAQYFKVLHFVTFDLHYTYIYIERRSYCFIHWTFIIENKFKGIFTRGHFRLFFGEGKYKEEME